MQGGWGRDWDALMRNYSSGDESDEDDVPNIVSFQRNARRNAELIQSFIPHMTPEGVDTIPPLLMKDPYKLHEGLIASGALREEPAPETANGAPTSAEATTAEALPETPPEAPPIDGGTLV